MPLNIVNLKNIPQNLAQFYFSSYLPHRMSRNITTRLQIAVVLIFSNLFPKIRFKTRRWKGTSNNLPNIYDLEKQRLRQWRRVYGVERCRCTQQENSLGATHPTELEKITQISNVQLETIDYFTNMFGQNSLRNYKNSPAAHTNSKFIFWN